MREFVIQSTHKPGELARITNILSLSNVNIKSIAALAVGNESQVNIVPDDVPGTRSALHDAHVRFEENELVGENVSILMPTPHKDQHDSYLDNFINTGVKKVIGKQQELEAIKKDGQVLPVELSVTQMDINGQMIFAGTLRDISERVKLREATKAITKELFASNLALKSQSRTDPLTGQA